MPLGERFGSGSGVWWAGFFLPLEIRDKGEGGWGLGCGQANELGSQCARVCQNYPLANYPLVCPQGIADKIIIKMISEIGCISNRYRHRHKPEMSNISKRAGKQQKQNAPKCVICWSSITCYSFVFCLGRVSRKKRQGIALGVLGAFHCFSNGFSGFRGVKKSLVCFQWFFLGCTRRGSYSAKGTVSAL